MLTGLLFVLHPIVTKSVTNIIGRGHLFAMASLLSGLLCYAKSVRYGDREGCHGY